jgi:hypothetical protein
VLDYWNKSGCTISNRTTCGIKMGTLFWSLTLTKYKVYSGGTMVSPYKHFQAESVVADFRDEFRGDPPPSDNRGPPLPDFCCRAGKPNDFCVPPCHSQEVITSHLTSRLYCIPSILMNFLKAHTSNHRMSWRGKVTRTRSWDAIRARASAFVLSHSSASTSD